MKKNVNVIHINLFETNNNNISSRKKESLILSNGGITSSKEKKPKKSNFIFSKKKLTKIIIPNSCYKTNIKKINNISDKKKSEHKRQKSKTNSNLSSQTKKNKTDMKRQNSSLIRRNKNSPFKLSTPGKTTLDNKKLNIMKNKNKNKLNNLLNNNNKNNNNFNSHRLQENKNNSKSKKISIFNNKANYYFNGNKVLSNGKSKEQMPIYHKKIDKNNKLLLIHKNKMNISSDNVKKSLNYYKKKENNFFNNNSLIIKNIKDNIYSKEINIRKVYYPRSPINKQTHFKKEISPIKKVNFIKNKQNENKLIIENKIINNNNKITKAPSSYRIFQTEGNFPNNHGFHEIIYKNSPKKTQQNNNIKDEEKNNNKLKDFMQNTSLRNNRPFLEELTTDNNNNNFNNISTTILLNNQSSNNIKPKTIVPYFCTLNSNKNLSLQNTIKDENYFTSENICLCSSQRNLNHSTLNPKICLSPKIKKIDISNDTDAENEDMQAIHYFGEQMLKRNKNYNFNKINDIYMFPIDSIKNSELKRNNSSSDINNGKKSNKKKGLNSIPFSYSSIQFKWKKYQKRNSNSISRDMANNKNKRFNHNIVNRRKNKKLVMEKSLNEQFISNAYKSKNNDFTKDKISYCESSINIDNDSINDIIKEFEKEIEAEEKRNKQFKNLFKRKELNNIENNNDNLLFSFLSENDNYSNLSKGSTDDSKIKKRKVRFYKTKNLELEKNYDFFISPTKSKKKK